MSDHDTNAARRCLRCGSPFEGAATYCPSCAHQNATADLPLDAALRAVTDDRPDDHAEAPAASASPDAEATGKDMLHGLSSQWGLAVVATAGALTGIVAMLMLGWLQAQTSSQPVDTAQAAPRPASAPAAQEAGPPPTWVGRRQAIWAADGSKTIAFELPASNDVPVWMSRVRPLLTVRCVSRSTEVFVAIRSAASIEPQAGSHTVRLQFDDDEEVVQRWSDSVSGHELFAPDGVALARRLAHARRMRLGFTPYNAQPVVVEFSVQGFEPLARLVAGTCGWRLGVRS